MQPVPASPRPVSVPAAKAPPPAKPPSAFQRWLLEGMNTPQSGQHVQHTWWQVMCLTGVDYFSTLGYQPGIAALAAGALSPLATLILVLLTVFGALPIYRVVAQESPHGEGSLAMLEHILRWWQSKLFILCLLGFVATDFIITITLSAADAAAHLLENPYAPHFLHGHPIAITLFLVALLGAVFLKGFKEAIGIAVVLVAIYLVLNAVVIGVALVHIAHHPALFSDWKHALTASHGSPLAMIGVALLLFPKLALGLSGFETGVAVMPLVKGDGNDMEERPAGRVRNTRRLLMTAALIMSVFLLTSSLVTTLLIAPADFKLGGPANGRALAFLAHQRLGNGFGTVYDLSTIAILWFAGASAMAGLLNIVPRYLPRYGMAPEWTRASRPLVLVYMAVAVVITLVFRASVDAQGGAYATGVLVLMTSAACAVTMTIWRTRGRNAGLAYGAIALVFAYTTIVNVIERPDGIRIAGFFIFTIVLVSLISRVWRTTELRVTSIEIDALAEKFIRDDVRDGVLRIVANRPEKQDEAEYRHEDESAREDHLLPPDVPLLFLEVSVTDPSEFSDVLRVTGVEVGPYRVLRAAAPAVPNAIAALLLHMRDETDAIPHAYFNWSEGNPLLYLIRYVLSGQGDVAPVTREVLRQNEPNSRRRPAIHAAV